MPHPTRTRPVRPAVPWPLAVLRGLFALAAWAALVVGVPAVLLAVGQLPSRVPSWEQARAVLMTPDDGTLLLGTLAMAAWICWAWLAIPVIAETLAVLLRRSAPRLPGMGTGQRLAGFLLGSILLASPAAAAVAAPAVAATAPHAPQTPAAPADTTEAAELGADAAEAPLAAGRQITIGEHGSTMWDLAEEHLGDGLRYKAIQQLNPQLAPGTFLSAGTLVTIPASPLETRSASEESPSGMSPAGYSAAEATGRPSGAPQPQIQQEGSARQSSEDSPDPYVVQPGDHLALIAQEQLGDADRWQEVFEANEGKEQPYGHVFTDPDLIFSGQELDLPTATATPPAAPQEQPKREKPAERTDPQPKAPTTGDNEQDAEEDHRASPQLPKQEMPKTAVPLPEPGTPSASSPSAPASDRAVPSDAAPTGQESDSGRQAGVFGLAATGVLAAGFLAVLGHRRIMQMRRRRRGRHIALPQGEAARAEHALHVTEAITDTAVLDAVLRTAAVHLTSSDRALPPLAAAVVGPHSIVLHLSEPADPVPPFTTDPDTLQTWTCPTATADILPQTDTDDVDPPYPALVSLGWDPDGRLVLIDLEHLGHLHLTGPAAPRVLRTLALELATSEFTHHLDLGIVGPDIAPGLGQELPERVTQHDDLDTALAALRAHHSEQQRALELLGAATMRRARTGVDTAAAWTPYLVVVDGLGEEDAAVLDDLLGSVIAEPRSATALLTSGDLPEGLAEGTWALHADPDAGPIRLPLPGLDLDCTVQALSDTDFAFALEILATSRADDVPAPEAEPHQPSPAGPLPASAVEDPDEDPDEEIQAAVVQPALRPVATGAGTSGAGHVPNLMAQFAVFDDEDDDEGGDGGAHAGLNGSAVATPVGPPNLKEDAKDDAVREQLPQDPAPGRGPVAAQQPTTTISVRLPDRGRSPDPEKTPPVRPDSAPGPAEEATGPVVRVLGPVDITGKRGALAERKRERICVELAAWLALHPGRDRHALDEAMWPDGPASRKYRNSTVSRLRTWLGKDDDGTPYFPTIPTTPDARYALSPAVDCDWHQFQELVRTAKQTGGPHTDQALRAALDLVRGRPFSSADRSQYRWAEHQAIVMIMEIIDAADLLAERRLAAQDPRGALWAATKGLEVAPEVEGLYRICFRAYAAIGDYDALERAAQQLKRFNEDNDLETEEDTLAVLNTFLTKA